MKYKTCHGKTEEKCQFGNPWSGFLGLKGGTPIMLGIVYVFLVFAPHVKKMSNGFVGFLLFFV